MVTNLINLVIDEEYGYRTWLAKLTEEEYAQLIKRWETMKGLSCLVPVKMIIPQAVEIDDEYVIRMLDDNIPYRRCHIHECDDSHLQGSSYKIPKHDKFCMNGVEYEEHQYWPELKE
ncbi:hypothetical protein C4577_06525 [Candidatus Parcubacteria bacterium]|nr:MAG: hypothetical protein C4577_06525 [Candidatus Parcubacteria bacterium]